MTAPGVVAIGTSWGGLSALGRILGALPGDFALPIVVVQHRSKDSDNLMAKLHDPVSKQPVQKSAAVRIERVRGADQRTWWRPRKK